MPLTRIIACCLLFIAAASVSSARGDVVTDWNSIWLDCIRATGGPPCPIARAGAMVHAAVHDAVNAIDHTYEPYLVRRHAPRGTSPEAAAASAAHDVLVYLYPQRRAILDAALDASLAQVPNGRGKQHGIGLGRDVAKKIIHARRRDGSENSTPYFTAGGPGDWIPTPPDFSNPATPNWGLVRPWAMTRGDQFRPVGPLGFTNMQSFLASPGYAQLFDEVKDLGARVSPSRTAYQTQTAFFWANDVDGTYKPPGHLNAIAQTLSAQQGNTLSQNARLFALLNIAMADAGIAAWDCKYDTPIDLWRPITGIRAAAGDGNAATVPDPTWEPLNAFTPPFPAYISGHATFAATAARIFANFFGSDQIIHSIGTDDPLYTGGPRTYLRFSDAALENARSRIYLGVHWQCDADDGIAEGTALGDFVYGQILEPAEHHGLIATDDPAADEVQEPEDDAPVRIRTEHDRNGVAIELELARAGLVKLTILDVQGRRVATLANSAFDVGLRRLSWDGRDARAARVPSGLYFVRVESAGAVRTQKVILAW